MERDLVDFLREPYRFIQEEKKKNAFFDLSKRHRVDAKVVNDLAAEVIRILRVESHLTLGSIPECLRALLKRRDVPQEPRGVVAAFATALDRGAENRNLLLHGREEARHFLDKEHDAWVWEVYLENYLDVVLNFSQILHITRDLADAFVTEKSAPVKPDVLGN